jgi:hypothetical protein
MLDALRLTRGCLLLATGLTAATAAAREGPEAASFLGQSVKLEYGLNAGAGWTALNSQTVTVGPGAEISNWILSTTQTGGTNAWSIDFGADSVSFRYVGTADFMFFGSPPVIGFRILDYTDHLTSFESVAVINTTYVPMTQGNLIEGFYPPTDLTFEEDSIYVNLWNSMYHHHVMPGMGDPYRDLIALEVGFANAVPESGTYLMLAVGLGTLWVARRRHPAGRADAS